MKNQPKPKKGTCAVLWVAYVKAGPTNADVARRASDAMDDLEECKRRIAALRVAAVERLYTEDGHTLRTAAAALGVSPTRVQQFLAQARGE